MYFADVNALIEMGGHGFYVWLSYGITIIVLVLLIVYPVRKGKKTLKTIRQRKLYEDKLGDTHADAGQA